MGAPKSLLHQSPLAAFLSDWSRPPTTRRPKTEEALKPRNLPLMQQEICSKLYQPNGLRAGNARIWFEYLNQLNFLMSNRSCHWFVGRSHLTQPLCAVRPLGGQCTNTRY